MKKIIFTTAMLFVATFATQAQQPATPAANPNQAEIQFEEESHEFGNIKEGTMATFEFKFKNTGNADLIISNASASCGCTIPSYPKEPIIPGGEGAIDVQFNSSGKVGTFDKNVTITSNTIPTQIYLVIRGEVKVK